MDVYQFAPFPPSKYKQPALLEIDSFVIKFKNMLRSGKTANLTFNVEVGKAEVNPFELGDVLISQAQYCQQRCARSRNGPSRKNADKVDKKKEKLLLL